MPLGRKACPPGQDVGEKTGKGFQMTVNQPPGGDQRRNTGDILETTGERTGSLN
jgi:hypothetical protein